MSEKQVAETCSEFIPIESTSEDALLVLSCQGRQGSDLCRQCLCLDDEDEEEEE